jgi:hypothetical protein
MEGNRTGFLTMNELLGQIITLLMGVCLTILVVEGSRKFALRAFDPRELKWLRIRVSTTLVLGWAGMGALLLTPLLMKLMKIPH